MELEKSVGRGNFYRWHRMVRPPGTRRLGPISKVSLERRQRVLPLRWAVVPRYIRDRQVRGCSSDSPRIYGGPDGSFSADMTGQGRVETLLRTLCACANATIRKYLVKNRLSNAIDWPI